MARPPAKSSPLSTDPFVADAIAAVRQVREAEKKQEERERDDLRFMVDQWPSDVRQSRDGIAASGAMPAIPARPCLQVDKIRARVRQVLNEERQADLAPQLIPADDFGEVSGPIDDSEIEVREGILRKILRDSEAGDAFSWAFARAVEAGRGYFGVMKRYLPGKTNAQELYFLRIYDQGSVTLGPHEQPDGSDAEWGMVWADISWEDYHKQYSRAADKPNALLNVTDAEFRTLGEEVPEWFTVDDKKLRRVRIADYYYTKTTPRDLATLDDGRVEWADTLSAKDAKRITDRRTVLEKQLKWAQIDGRQKLDETEWESRYVPIVKVIGEELQPYDAERRFEGMIRPSRDSQRGYNSMVSKWVEQVGLTPVPPLMVAEGQIESYEAWYEYANTRAFPYLPYRQRDLEGNPAQPPFATNRETQIEAISRSVAMFDQAIQSTSLVPDPTVGQTDPSLRSDRMVKTLVQQSQRGTSNYMDNLVRSIRHGARIANDLMPAVYTEGRIVQMMTGGGALQSVMIGRPFVQQPMGTGNSRTRPVAAPPNAPGAKHYKLTKDAEFNIAIKVTKNMDTRRQEEAAMMGEMIAKAPDHTLPIFGDLFFANLDTAGHKEIAERYKLMLAPPIQQRLSGQQPIPPQVQQQLQQSGKLIEELTAHVNELTQMIQTKQVEQQGALEKAAQDNATKVEIAKIQAGSALAVADLKTTTDQAIAAAKEAREQLEAILEAVQEQRLQREEHLHEATMAGVTHGHERAAATHDTILEMTRAAHEASVTPQEPTSNGSGE